MALKQLSTRRLTWIYKHISVQAWSWRIASVCVAVAVLLRCLVNSVRYSLFPLLIPGRRAPFLPRNERTNLQDPRRTPPKATINFTHQNTPQISSRIPKTSRTLSLDCQLHTHVDFIGPRRIIEAHFAVLPRWSDAPCLGRRGDELNNVFSAKQPQPLPLDSRLPNTRSLTY